MPPGSRQAMPMTATGLSGVLIIGAKDIADTESAPHYVRNGPNKTIPSSQQLWSCAVGCLNRWVATRRLSGCLPRRQCWGVCGHAGAFPEVSRLAAAATYWTRAQCLHKLADLYQVVTLTGAKLCEA